MAIEKTKLTDVTPSAIYDRLQEGIVFAGVEKKDGTVSYRGMTTAPVFLETLFKGRVSNTDKGKERKAHWSDGMSSEEKKSEYVEGRKPVYIYDSIRDGFKGASIYLGNIVTDEKVGDLDNLVFVKLEDVENNPDFKKMQEGKIDVRDFLSGKNDERESISWEKKKEFFEELEKGVYFATFRKKNGEPRMMVMTRNKEIVDEFAGEGAYESGFQIDEDSDEYLDIINTGVYPVYDLEKSADRKFNINASVEIGKYPRFKKIDVDDAVAFAIGDIEVKELVFGTNRRQREERKNLKGVDKRADLIADMGSSSTWNATWQHRMAKLDDMFKNYLPKEFKENGYDASQVGFSHKSHLNNKVIEVKIGKGEGLVYLLISPKGVYDVKNSKFEFKTNPGYGKDSNLGGLKDQRERMYMQRKVLGIQKALLINYILTAMDRRKKSNTVKYFDDKFLK